MHRTRCEQLAKRRFHAREQSPIDTVDRKVRCPNWGTVLERLWKSGDLKQSQVVLSKQGGKRIDEYLLLHLDGIPGPTPFRTHVGTLATGNRVVEDVAVFDRLSKSMRSVIGLEMEAFAIGAISEAWSTNKLRMIVMKGVMDFADGEKNDHFKSFASRASAECMIQFLRENLDSFEAKPLPPPPPPVPPPVLEPMAIAKLRQVPVRLFESLAQARIIADDVGLMTGSIDFSGSADTFWQAIIKQARRESKLLHLVEEARRKYPQEPDLQAVHQSLSEQSRNSGIG